MYVTNYVVSKVSNQRKQVRGGCFLRPSIHLFVYAD